MNDTLPAGHWEEKDSKILQQTEADEIGRSVAEIPMTIAAAVALRILYVITKSGWALSTLVASTISSNNNSEIEELVRQCKKNQTSAPDVSATTSTHSTLIPGP